MARYMLNTTQLIRLLTIADNAGGTVVIEETATRGDYYVSIPGEAPERKLKGDGCVYLIGLTPGARS